MSASEAVQEKTPAQRLAEEHAAHHATVEDTVDQDDIEHPPPPHANTDGAINGTNGVMSAKAAGKQKATEKSAGLNTQDEEAFPTLGGSSKSTAKAPGWGAKGGLKTSGSPSLYTPPGSGAATPSSVPALGAVNLPGKNRDHFDVEISDIDKTKSIEKVLADAKRKYRVNTGIQEINAGKARRFYAEGPQQNQVRQALMDISKAISKEQRLSIPVPATVSANIIGRAGANIRKLEEVHGVKINITRDSRGPSTNPDDPRIDTVEVRGDAAATRVVKQKIEDMVKQLQPKIDMPLRGIPPEFYPFLAGRHAEEISKLENDSDLRVKIPQYHTWQSQPPPRSAPKNARPSFVPHGDSHIVISGDQAAAMQARAAIEALAEQLGQELILEELMCEQVLHPYVVGHRGMDPLEFLEETGCAIILPPGHHETEEIHLIGPKEKLDAGRARAEQLIAQKHHRPYDLRKQFADAPMGPERHSRALAQYLQQKAFEREFRSTHQSDLVFPRQANADPSWGIVSSDGARAVAARSDLTKVLQAFPTARIGLVEVDPFYHEHLGNMHSQRMREDHGVHMIVPEDPEEPVVLVYEGPSQDGPFQIPRERPTSPEVKEFQRALQEAQALLMGSIPQGPISSHDMSVPRKHHDRVRRFVKNQQPQQASQFPVQLDFGNQRASKGAADSIFLRGPNDDDIAALRKAIEQYMIEVEQDEKERGYVTYTDFPEKFVKNLVGKNGANIKALREKHDVEIDAREPGKVKIQGPQKKAEACKAEIIKLGKSYEDEVNYTIKVDPKFHGELIGKSGENLNKLQSKVNNDVRIDFPRANRNADDNASEAGGNQRQAADEIRIRGPKAKADKIRDELLSLTQYLQDNSHTATVSVHKDQIRSLIGRGGAEMDKLRGETGAQIDVPNKPVEGDRVTITIKGPKAAVDKARQELQKRSKAFDAVVTKTITVDRKHHRDIIGSKGSNIQRIVQEAGGPERSAEAVQFPKQGETSNDLTIKGTEDVVDKIVAAIQAYVEDKDNQVTETVDVPVEQHRLLIGTNGNIRKSIEDKFKVSLDIPRRESGKTGVKIAGKPAEVQQAREHIISLTKRPEGTTILVPRALHHAISNEGRIFRDLSRRGIKIDHKGQQPPAKPKANGVGRKSNNAAAPLITDEPSDEAVYNFDIVSMNDQAEGETGEIPWILIGNKDVTEDAISKVRQQIEDAIEKAREPKHIGYLRLADPRLHRHVIGQRGATINEIRKKTGCDIQVPGGQKSQNDSEEITIVGDEDGVMLAKDLILQELEKASN